MTTQILLAVVVFTGIIVSLSAIILAARSKLVQTGEVTLVVNAERDFEISAGSKLLEALAGVGLHLPAGCGGKGTCGQCRVKVIEGGGPLLPTEESLIGPNEASRRVRLACQVAVRDDLRVQIPEEVFGVRRWECTVGSTKGVSTFIKEIVLELPPGEDVPFRAGGYIQVECPPYRARFSDFEIEPRYREEWDRLKLWRYTAGTKTATTRAYSMANYPEERGMILLNIGIALPPPNAADSVPPGVVSSYLFNLKYGDKVTIAGPYGEFYARDTPNEMIFIGGGTGMAPMRSHILDQLERIKTGRKMSFWFGVRTELDLFYHEEFTRLAEQHPNFHYTAALSAPKPDTTWDGPVGFIHKVLFDEYLGSHPAPEDCEYYMCGPPLMIAAVQRMLTNLGVSDENVMFDDFGS
jgi:Na+-transporting NADH:ubiquinone oxidoreductase subunit F